MYLSCNHKYQLLYHLKSYHFITEELQNDLLITLNQREPRECFKVSFKFLNVSKAIKTFLFGIRLW